MGFAISALATNETGRSVEALWDRAGRFEARPSMRMLGYPPHITFAIYDAPEVTEACLRAAVARAGAVSGRLHLSVRTLRTFEEPDLVVWAAPEPLDGLERVHRAIHADLDPRLCRPHYRPGQWIPHCTLAVRIADDRRAEARRFIENFDDPFDLFLDRIEGVALPSLDVVAATTLAEANSTET